ncbi:hypothetical protein [uncultured Streptomyces sp.]|uniref:hypothetical protein n=1 Tax=uncultured Streptomyces sp. TaxID=174707 RepID=UPI00262A3C0C|nr:hypothetical protein [uncultured Streptomyces sp.]
MTVATGTRAAKAARRRRWAGTALAAAVLVPVAACTGGSSGGDGGADAGNGAKAGGVAQAAPVAALREARKRTGETASARIEGTMELGTVMSMEQTGALDWSDGLRGEMTITYDGGTAADALKRSGGDGTLRALYLKDAYYAHLGDAFAAGVGGRHWIRYGYADLAAAAGAGGDAVRDASRTSTPLEGVEALLASGDLRKVGEEDVRGVAATHYSGTVDVAEPAPAGGLDAGELAAFRERMAAAGVTGGTVDVWLDADHLPVKKSERARTRTGTLNSTVFYSDYGVAVAAKAPAASDTVDFKEIAGAAATPGTAP